jgi:hypothetical protein
MVADFQLMFSRYSTQSHNTPPTIKTTDFHPDLFQPLARAYPKLRTFIELIKLNGHIFEHVYGQRCSDESVLNLESIIGRVCEAIGKPLRNAPGREGTEYDVLVKIHMFWYDPMFFYLLVNHLLIW